MDDFGGLYAVLFLETLGFVVFTMHPDDKSIVQVWYGPSNRTSRQLTMTQFIDIYGSPSPNE